MFLRQSPMSTTLRLLHHLFSTASPKLPPSLLHHHHRHSWSKSSHNNDDDNWNDAWETAWLPDDDDTTRNTDPTLRPPWETDVPPLPADIDAETKAFVADMNENWDERRRGKSKVSGGGDGEERENNQEEGKKSGNGGGGGGGLYSLENVKKDYRLKKQRVHAGLWVKEIEKLEEAKLGVDGGHGDDLDKLLDSCSEIFDSANNDLNNQKVPSTSEFQNKPDGWETTSKSEDGSVWEMSQREEDILLQEFERRMAFCKFQIASFIKSHIFSRRRPIDGWKYMIEVIGPNAKKGKGDVSRLPSLTDPATQSFTEGRAPSGGGRLTSPKRR